MKTKMKEKTLLKAFVALFTIIVVASCITPVDPTIDQTEASEQAILKEYIDTLQGRGLDVDTTDLGVYYVVDEVGNGVYPTDGDTCILKYQGFLLSSGYIFDNSAYYSTDSTYTYIIGSSGYIAGWDDGMRMVQEESTTYLIIPSSLAYGSSGYYTIGPYETLVFKIDMVEINQAY